MLKLYETCPRCGACELTPVTEESKKEFLKYLPNFYKEKQFCPVCKKEIEL